MRRIAPLLAAAALLSVGVLGHAAAAHASVPATLYVSPSGSDSADCSHAMPCQTISYAIQQAPDGGTVRVEAGFYNQTIDIEKPITLIGAGPTQTTVDGWNQDFAPKYGTVWIGGPNGGAAAASPIGGNVTIEGFTFQNPNPDVETGGEPMIFAIKDAGASDVIRITRNILSEGTSDPNAASDYPVGIDTYSSAAKLIVTNNRVEGVWQAMLLEDNGPATVQRNVFKDLATESDGTVAEGVTLLSDAAPPMNDLHIDYNEFVGYAGYGVALDSGYNAWNGPDDGHVSNLEIGHNFFSLGSAEAAAIDLHVVTPGSTLDNVTIDYNSGRVESPMQTIVVNPSSTPVTETHNTIS